ncbi:hypothetical protein OAM53_00700 [Candidatus Thioglobus sp.]|nr:hypothetical protein [Candidatus Thioglobus sp.]
MKILFALFFYLFLSNQAFTTEDVVTASLSSGYWHIESTKRSPNNLSKAILYKYSHTPEGELPKHRLKITTPSDALWIDFDEWKTIGRYKFIDNDNLFIVSRNFQTERQGIVDLKTRDITWIGGGIGELLSWNSKSKYGLVKLRGQKHYLPGPEWGAFWVDMIVDTKGNVIEVLSPNSQYLGECIPLNLILDQENKYPKLKQSMEECVYVER